jgi:hypothetical protein
MFVVFGASLAGIYLILRDLLPFLEAQRTGILHTRGYNRRKVLRADEPERFKALLRNRTDGMILGLLAIVFGILWLVFWVLALFALIPIGAIMTAMARRSKKSTIPVVETTS